MRFRLRPPASLVWPTRWYDTDWLCFDKVVPRARITGWFFLIRPQSWHMGNRLHFRRTRNRPSFICWWLGHRYAKTRFTNVPIRRAVPSRSSIYIRTEQSIQEHKVSTGGGRSELKFLFAKPFELSTRKCGCCIHAWLSASGPEA